MQHYGHTGNLGNECADHAAALGSLGLISSHNVATRWVRHNFDTSALMVVTASARFWKDWITLELKQRPYLKVGGSAVFTIGFFVSLTYAYVSSVIYFQPIFPRIHFTLQERHWKAQLRLFLPREHFANNMWNPLVELLFHEQMSGVLCTIC